MNLQKPEDQQKLINKNKFKTQYAAIALLVISILTNGCDTNTPWNMGIPTENNYITPPDSVKAAKKSSPYEISKMVEWYSAPVGDH